MTKKATRNSPSATGSEISIQENQDVVDLKKLLPVLEKRLKDVTNDTGSDVLFHLLSAFQDQIQNLTPGYFHKAFRQIDVVREGEGHVDMAIWYLLKESPVFWETFTDMYLIDLQS